MEVFEVRDSVVITAKELNRLLPAKSRQSIRDLIGVMNASSEQTSNLDSGTGPSNSHCLLLGAGASKTSGIRTGFDLVKDWRQEQFGELGIDINRDASEIKNDLPLEEYDWFDPLNEYASLIEKKYPMPRARRSFVEQEVTGKVPSIGYAYLVRLAEKGCLRTIFTTNFDDLINEAFYQFSVNRPLVCAHAVSYTHLTLPTTPYV